MHKPSRAERELGGAGMRLASKPSELLELRVVESDPAEAQR